MSQSLQRSVRLFIRLAAWLAIIAGAMMVAGCASNLAAPSDTLARGTTYHIGPGDELNIFVWQNNDLSTHVKVRPDGMVSLPLVEDVSAAGKTPTQLAHDIQRRLAKYVKDPVVTVMINSFVGLDSEQIRVIGEAAKPQAIPYHKRMTVLDAMITAGGLTRFAAGSRATLIRTASGRQESYALRLDKLLQDGDMSANVPLEPGDVIVIPQTYF